MSVEEGKWDQYIPDVGLEERKVLEGGLEIIQNLGIVDAYRRWCGKSEPEIGSRTESIMVSCPNPDHPDKVPSAWLNSEKNVYFCGSCQEGGDIMDIAANRFGIADYKKGRAFPALIETCLVDLGYDVEEMKVSAGLELAEEAKEIIAESFGVVDPSRSEVYPEYDLTWQDYPQEDTFLYKWMTATEETTIPDEFRLFIGMQMISTAVGRRIGFQWGETRVHSNTMVAYMGDTGSGKSRAISLANRLVRSVPSLKWDGDDPKSKGVKMLGRPGSGEVLIDMFSWLPPGAIDQETVNGWATMDELAELMTASTRKGSTLREILLQMYDGNEEVKVSSRGHGTSAAVRPHFNLSVGAQPEAMSHIMSGNDVSSGFTNRFMFVKGTPKPYIPFDELKPVDFGSLGMDLDNIRAWSEAEPMMYLDMHATKAVDEHLQWFNEKAKEGALFARLANHFWKLAILLACNNHDPSISVDILDQARKLVEFLMPTTHSIDEEISVELGSRFINHIEKYVMWWPAEKGEFASQSDCYKMLSRKHRQQRDLFDRIFNNMVMRGNIQEAPPTEEELKLKGRRTKRYMISDPLLYAG